MSVPVAAFFNNKGGVGKTTLVYHVAWMMRDLGVSVLAADLDPQSSLSLALMDESALQAALDGGNTVATALRLLLHRGTVGDTGVHRVADGLSLLTGDLDLGAMEDSLATAWCGGLDPLHAHQVLSAVWSVIRAASVASGAAIVLVDLGPNLGALNRAALLAADHIVVPLAPDPFCQQALRGLGQVLGSWRAGWIERAPYGREHRLPGPSGVPDALGYTVSRHPVRLDGAVRPYDVWVRGVPAAYHEFIAADDLRPTALTGDPACLAQIRHYHSLMAMAQEARKPVFHLRPADGARGAHLTAAQESRGMFESLATTILDRIQVTTQH